MKTIIILITLVIATATISCKKDKDTPIKYKDITTICKNLFEHGSADTSLLKGRWELEYFAKTLDGKDYRREYNPPYTCYLSFKDTTFGVSAGRSIGGNYYVIEQSNEISFILKGFNDGPFFIDPEREYLIEKYSNSIKNSICFVIIGNNKLVIYYKEDDDKDNIMIFDKKK